LKHVEGYVEGKMGTREKLKEVLNSYWLALRRGEKCWKSKEEALDRTPWRIRFGRRYGFVGERDTMMMRRRRRR
jgi:hypothetical protein